ncbi:MAG: SGNH/GDSL hydrolase family protein [Flavobacteriaceae bacterium]|nr:SGNH/GDSL hydrolase family protein [Flavobacteriaceae bacterium]
MKDISNFSIKQWMMILLLLMVSSAVFSQEHQAKRVLFIGNSFTYYKRMPDMVRAMLELDEVPLEIHVSAVGGSTWRQHYLKKKGTRTMDTLKARTWDYVLLQDHSRSTLDSLPNFKKYGAKLVASAKVMGAVPILYMTWHPKDRPEQQRTISAAYKKLGGALKVPVIPVGDIFYRCGKRRPEINLYADKKHPSEEAAYLIALVMYRALTGNSVKNIPDRLVVSPTAEDGAKELVDIDHSTGQFMRRLVDRYKTNGWIVMP